VYVALRLKVPTQFGPEAEASCPLRSSVFPCSLLLVCGFRTELNLPIAPSISWTMLRQVKTSKGIHTGASTKAQRTGIKPVKRRKMTPHSMAQYTAKKSALR